MFPFQFTADKDPIVVLSLCSFTAAQSLNIAHHFIQVLFVLLLAFGHHRAASSSSSCSSSIHCFCPRESRIWIGRVRPIGNEWNNCEWQHFLSRPNSGGASTVKWSISPTPSILTKRGIEFMSLVSDELIWRRMSPNEIGRSLWLPGMNLSPLTRLTQTVASRFPLHSQLLLHSTRRDD